MATYKEIKGVTVQTLDSDPVVNVGAWSSGGAMNTAREGHGAAGTQDAALAFTGNSPPQTVNNEQYNGTSWTELANVNTGRYGIGSATSGTTTAALGWGGLEPSPSTKTESWNGSAWSEVNDLNDEKYYLGGIGTQTAALAFGGARGGDPEPILDESETWNGSSWTEGNNLNTGRKYISGTGSSTAGLAIGGTEPSTSAKVESYNGTSWTETTDINTARYGGASSSGPYTSSVFFGGNTGSFTGITENWDGTSWTEVADMAAARATLGGNGTSTAALAHGGQSPVVTTTEEFSFPPPTAAILTEGDLFLSGGTTLKGFGKAAGIPAATFASGGSLNTARGYHGGAGTDHEALLAFGGTTGTAVNNVEQYNGSSWSEVAEINTTRANVTGFGSSTAAIAGNGSTPDKSQVESWNGSAWTEIAELNTSRSDSASAGIQTSGMVATGTPVPGNPALQPGGTSTVTETWNGTSWTEVGDTNTKRLQAGMAVSGTTSAGIIAAGEDGPGSRTVNAETWNGTSWTEVSNISQQRGTIYNFMGHSTSANMAGGYSGTARVANNEHWNGSSWTEINDLSTARNAAFGAGSAVNGAVFGGDTGDYQSATEEFIADNALSTVTVS